MPTTNDRMMMAGTMNTPAGTSAPPIANFGRSISMIRYLLAARISGKKSRFMTSVSTNKRVHLTKPRPLRFPSRQALSGSACFRLGLARIADVRNGGAEHLHLGSVAVVDPNDDDLGIGRR